MCTAAVKTIFPEVSTILTAMKVLQLQQQQTKKEN